MAIVGGGLSGLALSIQLARKGHSVILFEKEKYPFHKVCGEYISLESWDFLVDLSVDLVKLEVPVITRLQITSKNGRSVEHSLPLGGFGISRYLLDQTLAEIAIAEGVNIYQACKVTAIRFINDEFIVESTVGNIEAKVACGTFGKRSNLDIKWKRKFSGATVNKLNNYVGIKYHVTGNFQEDLIGLHNFHKGYCGIVRIEGNRYNLCYLTTAKNLRECGNDIHRMENEILSANPFLSEIFTSAKFVNKTPLTISQISFDKKSQVEDHVLMSGDSAGMITPLCGNGMSMALHGSKLAAIQINHFLLGLIGREKMEKRYSFHWKKQFSARLKTGRRIQKMIGNNLLSSLLIHTGKRFPSILDFMIRRTHGKSF